MKHYEQFPLIYTGLLFNDVYSASKFAVEGFCESLAVQAMKFNIKYVRHVMKILLLLFLSQLIFLFLFHKDDSSGAWSCSDRV